MSNKTQLQTNNTALDGYIARINAAKETAAGLPEAGGSSGGGTTETCTVTLVRNAWTSGYYVTYVNGELTTNNFTNGNSTLVLSNVCCNTPLVLLTGLGLVTISNENATLVCQLDFLMDYSTQPYILMCHGDTTITVNDVS